MNILVDTKRDMRNGDCMWSAFGTANTCHSSNNNNNSSNNNCSSSSNNNCCNSNSNSAASSYNESRAVPPSIVMLIKPEMCDDDDQEEDDVEEDDDSEEEEENKAERCNSINNINKLTTFATSDRITIMHNKNRTMATMQQRFSKINTHKYSSNNVEQHIPPGASLLRKSNPPLAASAGLKSSGSMVRRTPKFEEASCPSTMMAAPPVFRHTVDLAACLMGSNNISLTTGSIGSGSNCDVSNHHIIDHISRELQNEKSRFDSLPSNYQPQITDVLDYINQQVSADAAAASSPLKTTTAATTTAATAATTTTTTMSPPATNSDCDSDDGDCSMVDSSCGSSSYMRHISDHSYTRSEMETNLETPSDSDEEIDVVSLNDKKLPTNPSDRDRRALQTKVAHKISTIPPPRRNRFELPYTPASSSPVKSEANSRFPSPSSTPYQSSGAAVATVYSPLLLRNSNSSSSSSSSSSAGSDCATPASTLLWGGDNINTNGGGSNKSSRKRYQDTCRSSAFSKQLQASKKSRAKLNHSVLPAAAALHSQLKQQPTLGANSSSSSSSLSCASSSSSGSNSANSSSNSNSVNFSIMKRQFSMDEADTIEKRNLHNDMERQRRIGLKNLFEALKKQIPNIRDKERAPKVNILREAAKLCEQLTNEERELSLKRQLLKAKQKQRQEMIARLRLSANAAE
ncbi:hypothetical protein KR044_008145 [Drosophila immigrans]|nr:hypothetical protein KR044_008145 [Drosophila immigrans]